MKSGAYWIWCLESSYPWDRACFSDGPWGPKQSAFLTASQMESGLPIPVLLGFPCGSVGKESACKCGIPGGSVPELRRSPGEGKGHPLWYSGLENSMDLYLTAGSDPTLWNPCILPYLKQWVGSLWTSSKIIVQSDLLLLFSC